MSMFTLRGRTKNDFKICTTCSRIPRLKEASARAEDTAQFANTDKINLQLMKENPNLFWGDFSDIAFLHTEMGLYSNLVTFHGPMGITAATSQPTFTRFDFDAPLMLAEDIGPGGIVYQGSTICLPETSGLGFDYEQMEHLG